MQDLVHSSDAPMIDDVSFTAADSSAPPSPPNETTTTTAATRTRRNRTAPKSQAKRRLEAMATSVDHKLAAAFTIVFVLYALITLGTWMSLEGQQYRSEVIELTAAQSTTSDLKSNKPGTAKASVTHVSNSNSGASSAAMDSHQIRVEDIDDIETLQHTFPIHASQDTEIIDHPGILLATKESMEVIMKEHAGSMPADGKMKVPKFWSPTCYGPKGVRYFLGNHGETLITPEQAAQIGSYLHFRRIISRSRMPTNRL
jgi:hypothetical protein